MTQEYSERLIRVSGALWIYAAAIDGKMGQRLEDYSERLGSMAEPDGKVDESGALKNWERLTIEEAIGAIDAAADVNAKQLDFGGLSEDLQMILAESDTYEDIG